MSRASRLWIITGLLAVSGLVVLVLPNLQPSQASPPIVATPTFIPAPANFYGMISHGDGCNLGGNPGGLIFDGGGSGEVWLLGGNIHSDSCLEGNGGVSVTVLDGEIEYMTNFDCNGGCNFSPLPIQVAEPSDLIVNDFVDCSGLPIQPDPPAGISTISPGIYDGFSDHVGDEITMTPGLYCFTGDLNITNAYLFEGNDVTLYFLDGNLTIIGDTVIELTAPDGFLPAHPNQGYLGLLVLMSQDNLGTISIDGNSNSIYRGTIYAGHPDSEIVLASAAYEFLLNLYAAQITLYGVPFNQVIFPKNFRLHLNNTAPATVLPGELITYTLTISNFQSFSGIENVILTDTVPAGTEFLSATQPFTLTGNTLTWALDYLPHKGIWQTQLVVQVPLTTTLEVIVNDEYGVRGDFAIRSPGVPVTTTINSSVTATPSPTSSLTPTATETPTPTATASPSPTPSATPSATLPPALEYPLYIPIIHREP